MFSNFAPYDTDKRWIFNTPAPAGTYLSVQWHKPADVNFIAITCIGAGGGGGNSNSGSSGTSRTGGGGGGSGAITRVMYPAYLLPDTLYVLVGAGGAAATNGNFSAVLLYNNNITVFNRICYADAGLAGGVGTAGTGGVATSVTSMAYLPYGTSISTAGKAGAAGGVGNVAGDDITALDGFVLTGGAGGGGSTNSSFRGGNIITRGFIPQVAGGNFPAVVPTDTPWAGFSGLWFWKPVMAGTGGAGGQGVNINAGGYGGNGAYGCGGGGGGAGTISGVGGRGGDGLVIIECW